MQTETVQTICVYIQAYYLLYICLLCFRSDAAQQTAVGSPTPEPTACTHLRTETKFDKAFTQTYRIMSEKDMCLILCNFVEMCAVLYVELTLFKLIDILLIWISVHLYFACFEIRMHLISDMSLIFPKTASIIVITE